MAKGRLRCLQLLLILFNIIFLASGIGLIVAGAIVNVKFKDYTSAIGDQFGSAASLLIAAGTIIFAIAFFGCCSVWKEKYFCVMCFGVMLVIIFILEVAGGISGYVLHGQVEDEMTRILTTLQKRFSPHNSDDIWNFIQPKFSCCGVYNYSDWTDNKDIYAFGPDVVPRSCCVSSALNCTGATSDVPSSIYTKGCVHMFETYVKDNIYIIGGIGIGFAFIQIAGITLVCSFARVIKREKSGFSFHIL